MKKAFASITLLCYLFVTCGITMNSHYCMNRLASVHLFETKAQRCGQCGMDIHKSEGCCRDEVTVVKLDQDQNKIPVVTYELPALDIIAVIPSVFISTAFQNIDVTRHFSNHSPPLLSASDTYLQNNVFRI
jgi:hypothetical protein